MKTTTISRAAKAVFIAALLSGASTQAFAQDAQTDRIAALEAQIQALAAQVADLKESTAADAADIRTTVAATTVSIPNGKPTIASGDGKFSATFHGIFQLDAANYSQTFGLPAAVTGFDLNSGTNIRRARIGVDGKVFTNFDYSLLFDFGGSGADGPGALQEAFLQYNGFKVGETALRLRVGVFAPNLGLEDAASTNGSQFLERASPAELARSLAGADKRIALQLAANGDHWLASGAVTGAKAGDAATFDEQLGFTARVAATPLYGYDWRLHVGANASYVARPAQPTAGSPVTAVTLSDRPELRVDGTQLITTGAIDADHASHYGAEVAFQKKQFLIQGEYFKYNIDRRLPVGTVGNPDFDGWYVEGGWVLTGEARKYNNVTGAFDAPAINNPFSLADHHWGAWEVVARYSQSDLNFNAGAAGTAAVVGAVRGGEQDIATIGVNWFPNAATKFALHYQDVSVDRLNGAGVQIGQDYHAVALRSQFAF